MEKVGRVKVHGHRGSRGYRAENTLPSFEHALELGADFLELDVVVTGDHHILVSHDPYMHHIIMLHPSGKTISETESRDLNIFRMPLDEVQSYPCSTEPHPQFQQQQSVKTYKPTLGETIKHIHSWCDRNNRKRPGWNIEIKSRPDWDGIFQPSPPDYVKAFADEMAKHQIEDLFVQSFDQRIMNELHKTMPSLKLVYLNEERGKSPEEKLAELSFKPYGYSPNYRLIDESTLKYGKDHGLEIIAWTVNTTEEIAALIDAGVHHIISDYPGIARQVVLAKEKHLQEHR